MPARDARGRPAHVKRAVKRTPKKAVAGPPLPGTRPGAGRPGGKPASAKRRAKLQTKEPQYLRPRRHIPGYEPKKKRSHAPAVEARERRAARRLAIKTLRSDAKAGKPTRTSLIRTFPKSARKPLRSALSATKPKMIPARTAQPPQRGSKPEKTDRQTEAGLFGFGGKGMRIGPKLPIVGNVEVEDIPSAIGGGIIAKKGLKTVGTKIAQAGGTRVASQKIGRATVKKAKQTPGRVKTYPARKAERIKTTPARTKATVKKLPSEVKAARKRPVKQAGKAAKVGLRHPLKTVGTGYAGASPALVATGTTPDAPVEFAKAQAKEFVKRPGRYIRRSGAFVPGAATGAASLAINAAASPFTRGESGKLAFKELVESNKEFAGYLSSDPKKHKKLAEDYGLGPAVVAALPLSARRSRKPKAELKKAVAAKGKPQKKVEKPATKETGRAKAVRAVQRNRPRPLESRRQRLRMARKVGHARNKGSSNIARAQKRLLKKSTFSKLDNQHQRAAILLTDSRIATKKGFERQTVKDLKREAAKAKDPVPGTDPHTAAWLLEQVKKDPEFIHKSGLETARAEYASGTGRLDTRLLGATEQAVRREAPHMQERGKATPSQAREARIKDAKEELALAKRLTARYTGTRQIGRARERVKQAQADLEAARAPVTSKEQLDFLRESKSTREAEGKPEPAYSKQTPLEAHERAALQNMAPEGRGFKSIGTRLRKRTGTTQAEGTRSIDVPEAIQSDIVAPRHRNMLVDITDALASERHLLTKDEMAKVQGKTGVTFGTSQNRGSLTPKQAKAAVDAGVFDSKHWTFMPESKRLREEAIKRPDELAGKLAQPGQNLNAWLDTAEKTWGKGTTLQAIPRKAAEEWVAQAVKSSEGLGRFARTSGRIQSAALLAQSLFWVPAQIIIEGGTAAIQVGIHRWPGLIKDIYKMTDEQKAKLDADAGQAAALGQLDDWGKRVQSTADFVKEGEKLQKGFLRSHWHRPVTELFTGAIKADRFKGRQFRRINQFGKAVKAADAVLKAAKLSTAIPRAKKYEWLEKNHPAVLKEISDNTMDMMGDWTTVTRSGKLGGERAFATGGLFYGMVRYTTHFIFSAFPRQHPIVAPILYYIGIQNTKRLEELFAGDPDYFAQLMQALVYTRGANKPPKLADISRIAPGGNAALEIGLSAKAKPTTALHLAQPIFSTLGLSALGFDPQTGRQIIPQGATVTKQGKILQKGGTVEGLTLRQVVKAMGGSTAGLSSGVRLAEQITGRTGRGVGPGGELNLPFTKAPKFSSESASSAFYKAVLPTSKERFKKGYAPPLNTLPTWKQRALKEYQALKNKKEFLGRVTSDGYPMDLVGQIVTENLSLTQARKAFRDGVKARQQMSRMEEAAQNGTLQQLMEKRIMKPVLKRRAQSR